MNDGVELLKSLKDEYVQRVSEKNKPSGEYYKNLNKHGECTKCHAMETRDNYKKDRTICRKCFCENIPEKVSSKRDRSNKQDSSSKQISSRKQVCSEEQDNSNKQDRSKKQDRSNIQDSSIIL